MRRGSTEHRPPLAAVRLRNRIIPDPHKSTGNSCRILNNLAAGARSVRSAKNGADTSDFAVDMAAKRLQAAQLNLELAGRQQTRDATAGVTRTDVAVDVGAAVFRRRAGSERRLPSLLLDRYGTEAMVEDAWLP